MVGAAGGGVEVGVEAGVEGGAVAGAGQSLRAPPSPRQQSQKESRMHRLMPAASWVPPLR